jgi:hypothetical protein
MSDAKSLTNIPAISLTRGALRRHVLKEVHACPGMSTGQIQGVLARRGYDVRRRAVALALLYLRKSGRVHRYTKLYKRVGEWREGSAWAPTRNEPADPFEGLVK